MRDFQRPGRSPVHGMNGAIATSHPLATAAGLEVLRRGGHAMDAAIAASAVLCVVEPGMTGVGGDNFTLIAPGDGGPVIGYNGSGRAPAGIDLERLRSLNRSMPRHNAQTVTVPGAVEAWCRLHARFGRIGLDDLIEPAIRLATDGYVIHGRVAFDWASQVDKLARDPGASATMLVGGAAPAAGSVHRQPALARTLAEIARNGHNGFYAGWVAEDMVKTLRALGGAHTLDDFAAVEGEFVTPISTGFAGHELLACPPNGQGITALIMLNILSGFDRAGLDPLGADRIHLFVEAAKRAYGDRDALIADPRLRDVPVERMLSEAHAAEHRAAIHPGRAGPTPPHSIPTGNDTIYLTVVDRDRNAVSFINSIFENFGSGIMAPESGVMFHNRGYSFRLDPDHPNVIAPGKRPMHTITPAMLMKEGRAVMPYGVMGAHFQPFGQCWMLTNMLDHGLDIQEAQDLPRPFGYAGEVVLETSIPEATAARLTELGHRVLRTSKPHGGSQGILIDWTTGVLSAGSDPRKDGCALAW